MVWEGPFTVSFWMAPDFVPQGLGGLVASDDSTAADDTWQIELLDPQYVQFHSNLVDVNIGVAADDVWMHVAAAYDGVDIHTWADGVPVASAAWVAAEPPEIQVLFLGTVRNRAGDFDGLMDDVLLFNRALTDVEVAALFDGTASCLSL
jgi:hypothetical protein